MASYHKRRRSNPSRGVTARSKPDTSNLRVGIIGAAALVISAAIAVVGPSVFNALRDTVGATRQM